MVIPRPRKGEEGGDEPGVGLVFLHYKDDASAARARVALHGRTFGGQPIDASVFPKERFDARDFS